MRVFCGASEIFAMPLAWSFEDDGDWAWRTITIYIGPLFIALEWRVG